MKISFLLISIILSTNIYSQFGSEQIITTDMHFATSVYASDIDGDGDMDVLAASLGYDKLTWYENTDGNGNFSSENFISNITDGAFAIISADIDNDGDNDVLNASLYWDSIVWYSNWDGQGTYWPRFVENGVEDYGVWWVYPGDVDNDGDVDLIYCYGYDDKIVMFINLDGLGTFSEPQIITEEALRPTCAYFGDLDGDGDFDILSSSLLDDKIAWYENLDGFGNFGPQITISNLADEATSVCTIDIDGDGDLDILSSSQGDNKIAWYENMNGSGDFGPQQLLPAELEEPEMVFSQDLDGDGDNDVLVASSDDDKIVYFENLNGLGSFSAQQTVSENADGANSIYTADLDGDGDLDILSSSWYDGKIAWYENLSILSNDQYSTNEFFIYPNPTLKNLYIQSKETNLTIEIYNNLGQKLLSKYYENQIDVSELNSGVYFLKILSINGDMICRKVVKQ